MSAAGAPPAAALLDLRASEEECGDTALALVRKELKKVEPGQVMEIWANVAEHVFMVRAWAKKTGRPLVYEYKDGKETHLFLEQING